MTNLSTKGVDMCGPERSEGVGSEEEEHRDVREEETEAPGDRRDVTRSGLGGWALPGEGGAPARPLGGRVGVPLWLEYPLEGDSVRSGDCGGRREPLGDKPDAQPVEVGGQGAAPIPSDPPVVGGRGSCGCCLRSGLGGNPKGPSGAVEPR
jgi:hypothetical protein